jgi:hypothetical protein
MRIGIVGLDLDPAKVEALNAGPQLHRGHSPTAPWCL